MQKPFYFVVPALILSGAAVFSSSGAPAKTGSKTPPKSTSTKPTGATKKGFAIFNVSKGSDVIRTPFIPSSVTSNHAPFDHNSDILMVQTLGKTMFGPLSRSVQISENNRRSLFENSVGKSLPVGSGGFDQGAPTVLVKYRQNNPPGRWRAISGTVRIDSYRRNSPLTEIVTFRLVNARFTPFFRGSGQFNLSLKATSSGARNPN